MKITPVLLYVGIGCLVHYLLLGDVVNFYSAWTYGVVFAWPVALAIKFFWWALLTVVCGVVLFFVGSVILDVIAARRQQQLWARRNGLR